VAAAAEPGQFVMLRLPGRLDPLLPRPMSISEASPGEGGNPGRIRILHKVVGRGTSLLAALAPGDRVDVLGPLGVPFRVPRAPRSSGRALMIAGGIGVAVFPFLVPALRSAGWRPLLLFGARGEQDLVRREWFGEEGIEVRTATEDGSHGLRGLVTTLLEDALTSAEESRIAYACGPRAMLRAVAEQSGAAHLSCQLSLEAFMGCGFGVCLGCVVKVRSAAGFAYARVCVEGPTLEATEVLWD
jgi:dihydroorotate dehydrogenase electron transfer subunit